jgi:hypothetical protein
MTEKRGVKELNQEHNLQFQRKTWRVQRVAWIALLVFLTAGAAGLFGGFGPLTYASAGDVQERLHIDYFRFTQYLAPVNFQIRVRTPDDGSDSIRLWIDRPYLDAFIVQSITPDPDSVESAPDRLIYEFPLAAEAGGTITITLNVRPIQVGQLNGRVGLEGGPTLEFSQFNYP